MKKSARRWIAGKFDIQSGRRAFVAIRCIAQAERTGRPYRRSAQHPNAIDWENIEQFVSYGKPTEGKMVRANVADLFGSIMDWRVI